MALISVILATMGAGQAQPDVLADAEDSVLIERLIGKLREFISAA